jgi:hypothetical protein
VPNQIGEQIYIGSYEQLKLQMSMSKNTQQIVQWYGTDEEPRTIQPTLSAKRNDKAWVHLMFLERRPRANSKTNNTPTADKSRKKEGQISFRLMDVQSPTRDKETLIPRERFIPLAERIRAGFATPVFVWKKGKELFSYCEHDLGLQLQMLVIDEPEARRITSQVTDLISVSPQWKYLTNPRVVDNAGRYPTTEDSINIMGETEKFPEERPIVNVEFRYASLYFPTISKTYILYDTTGTFRNPVLARY